MNEQTIPNITKTHKKTWYKQTRFIVAAIIILIAGTVSAKILSDKQDGNTQENKVVSYKPVETVSLNLGQEDASVIETVGSVKAETKVDIVATTRGAVRSIYFEVGDSVFINKTLAYLYDNSTLTNLNNAQTNLINTQGNLDATKRVSSESVRQAELGVQAAEEAIEAAEISLETTKTNLDNARALKVKGNEDTKANAIISFSGILNTIDSALDQINSIIDAEDNKQLQVPGISSTLGAKIVGSVGTARTDYRQAKNSYENLLLLSPSPATITGDMAKISATLDIVKISVDSTIYVLDNTVTNPNFTINDLNSQKSAFSALKDKIVGSQASTKNILQSLQNLDLFYNQEINALESAVVASENRLVSAQTGLTNALVALDNAKQAQNQQILNSNSAVDNARGQLNLARVQSSDLTIKAPISGIITKKNVEIGAEINPGQSIAEISKTDQLIIEVSLASEDIYRIKTGQIVELGNDGLTGKINSIDPAADPVNKKVRAEILFDNKDNKLIQGTFIDVRIPIEALEKTHPESLYIPLRAVSITQNESSVFIVNGDMAKKIKVTTGNTEGALIEVIDGLNPGDELIVEGNKSLEDGDLIEIIK